MPRRPTYLKKSGKIQVDKLERKCRYCKTHRSARRFDKHEAWCKKTWMIRKELQDVKHTHAIVDQLQAEATRSPSPTNPSLSNNNLCRPVEGVRICEIEGTVKVIEEDVGMNSRHWHRVLENGGMGDLD